MAEEPQESTSARFGTFTGVFTPTLLTILGVIMYVRMGWVVGNAGLGGAIIILVIGLTITLATGLSLSSIATNTRIGAGGSYAILNRSLGLEVGGSIGIPLFLTRPLGVAMYIFGFREGLLWVFPSLPALPVDLCMFALIFGIAFRSADLAFKTQHVIMVVIALSLVSIFASDAPGVANHTVEAWGSYPGSPEDGFTGTSFWQVFAVFFPATTGILAGANMSGDLKDPRRAIPVGTLAAIALASVVYIAVAVWVANVAPLDELASNYNAIIDNSLFPGLVLAGLLGATASSALAGLVGGPRILMAMGQNGILPFSDKLAELRGGEPRNALLVTGVLTLAAIMVRDLNAIAPIVTMFFLITYGMINLVVLIEGGLGLVSFRPTLRLPLVVPFVGMVGSIFSMFVIHPTFSLISVVMVVALYLFIRSRVPERDGKEDVRSSIFVAVAEWAAGQVTSADLNNVRAWRPNLLVPVEDSEELRGSFQLLYDIARPEGTVKLMGLTSRHPIEVLQPGLTEAEEALREHGVLSSSSMVALPGYVDAVGVGAMALQGAFFRPNLLFLRMPAERPAQDDTAELIATARDIHMGVALFAPHASAGLGRKQDITLWVRRGIDSWAPHAAFDNGSLNLILLMGYRLWRLWGGRITLATVIGDAADSERAHAFLGALRDLARLPDHVERHVAIGSFEEAVKGASTADLSILGLQREAPEMARCAEITSLTRSSCLFVLDGGHESARA